MTWPSPHNWSVTRSRVPRSASHREKQSLINGKGHLRQRAGRRGGAGRAWAMTLRAPAHGLTGQGEQGRDVCSLRVGWGFSLTPEPGRRTQRCWDPPPTTLIFPGVGVPFQRTGSLPLLAVGSPAVPWPKLGSLPSAFPEPFVLVEGDASGPPDIFVPTITLLQLGEEGHFAAPRY